jgi:hypothetical protein
VVVSAGLFNRVILLIESIVTPDFLESEVLRPFTKADPFMPGSGLGLGLAQRMIEILGGKLAIASTIARGTLVHIEIPLHLLNKDTESDESQLEDHEDAQYARAAIRRRAFGSQEGESSGNNSRGGIREDGIYMAGFDIARAQDPGVRRVGKSLLRQLKLNSCRVVTEIRYASLIIAPDVLDGVVLAELHGNARPGAQIVILEKEGRTRAPTDMQVNLENMLAPGTIVKRHKRPLRPSLIRRIMRPPEAQPAMREVYQSAVVGGPGSNWDQVGQREDDGIRRASDVGEPGFARDRMETSGSSVGLSRSASNVSTSAGMESQGEDALLPSPNQSPEGNLGRLRSFSRDGTTFEKPEVVQRGSRDASPRGDSDRGGLHLEGVPPLRPVLGGHHATDPVPLSHFEALLDGDGRRGNDKNTMEKIGDDFSDGTTPSSNSGGGKERKGSLHSDRSEGSRPGIQGRASDPVEMIPSPQPPRVAGDPLRGEFEGLSTRRN